MPLVKRGANKKSALVLRRVDQDRLTPSQIDPFPVCVFRWLGRKAAMFLFS